MINLREINYDNYLNCYELEHNDQKFVESPVHILAEAYVGRRDWTAYGIYWHNDLIGMVSIRNVPVVGLRSYAFSELLIADNYRRKGLGRAAVKAVLHKLKNENGFTTAKICVHKDNEIARKFYMNIGFNEGTYTEWSDDFIEYYMQL